MQSLGPEHADALYPKSYIPDDSNPLYQAE